MSLHTYALRLMMIGGLFSFELLFGSELSKTYRSVARIFDWAGY